MHLVCSTKFKIEEDDWEKKLKIVKYLCKKNQWILLTNNAATKKKSIQRAEGALVTKMNISQYSIILE